MTLRFVESWYVEGEGDPFDVLLEGERVLEGCDLIPSSKRPPPNPASFEVRVADGTLDVDLASERGSPGIVGIEVERLD
ncbi:MAG: hypothetical protein HY721_14310 [Planctomycetes bacterium]|nr:hypothetical protein [Planctomycetota bacterium]